MSILRYIAAGVTLVLWAVTYLYAFFVDRALLPAASEMHKPAMLVLGFLFGKEALDLIRGKADAPTTPQP